MGKAIRKDALRRLTAVIVATVVAVCALCFGPTAYAASFCAVNDVVLYNVYSIQSGNEWYVPSDVFESVGIKTVYDNRDNLTFQMGTRMLTFNLGTGTAYDHQYYYAFAAIQSGGKIYVPAYVVCSYFKMSCTLVESGYGTIVRIQSVAGLSEERLIEKWGFVFEMMTKSTPAPVATPTSRPNVQPTAAPTTVPVTPGPTATPKPTATPTATPTPVPVYALYPMIELGESETAARFLDILDEYGVKGSFCVSAGLPEETGTLLRRIAGSGHSLIATAHGEAEELGGELSGINAVIRRDTLRMTRLCYIASGSEPDLESRLSLISGGYRFWDPDLSATGKYSALARDIGRLNRNAAVYFPCTEEGLELFRELLQSSRESNAPVRAILDTEMPMNRWDEVR